MRQAALKYTEEQRAAVVMEVVEKYYSPVYLGKKYQISAWKIRDWVGIAVHRLLDFWIWYRQGMSVFLLVAVRKRKK